MAFLAEIPGWAWFLILLIGLVLVYGWFNRRWIREEQEKANQQAAVKPDEEHPPVKAASLRPPPGEPPVKRD